MVCISYTFKGVYKDALAQAGKDRPPLAPAHSIPERAYSLMMEKVQRFGSAMLAPVLLFAFAGLAVGIAIIAQNGELIPLAADKESAWNHFWSV